MHKRPKGKPHTFQYALFIRHDILGINGPLIDRPTLQAFLGIKSPPEKAWKQITSQLGAEVSYRGVLADSFPRYWRDQVLARLESITATSSWLSLPAKERVARLRKLCKDKNLVPAEPIAKGYATDYDCICAVSQRALAKRNGYRLHDGRPLPWKQPDYVSGVEYRKKINELSKSRPLEAEDKARFNTQFGVRS
jgi:hypothetical protein